MDLVLGIDALPQTVFDDPEARLYAGLAELTIASKILLTETDDFHGLPLAEQFLIGVTALQEAIQNFELGLARPKAERRPQPKPITVLHPARSDRWSGVRPGHTHLDSLFAGSLPPDTARHFH